MCIGVCLNTFTITGHIHMSKSNNAIRTAHGGILMIPGGLNMSIGADDTSIFTAKRG